MRSRWSIPALMSLSLAILCANGCTPGPSERDAGPTTRRDNTTANEQNADANNDAAESTDDDASGGSVELGPTVTFVGLTAQVPTTWQSEMPSSNMRVAQFVLPGTDGAGDAQLVIYDFGPGQGGSVLDNIRRWSGQVTDPSGNAVPPTVTEADVAGMTMTKVEATGTFASGMPGDSESHENTTVINVQLVKSPDQSIYFKLLGPKETVAAHRAGFEAMLSSIKPAE